MRAGADPLFRLRDIRKSYGSIPVLKKLDLDIFRGDFLLLLGANGSGKSTLLRICVGLARPDSGTVASEPARIGHAGHALFLYSNLTLRENLQLAADLTGANADLGSYLDRWQLTPHANKKIHQLSKGLQYRASICRALLTDPAYMFFDEPTSSLDEVSNRMFLDVLEASLAGDSAGFVVIATHDLARLRERATRVVVLHEGSISFDSLDEERRTGSRDAALAASIEFYLEVNR